MLDDDHRVAEISEALEALEQARIVALVQADARLIEHVQHPRQRRPDLRGEPDSLGFTAAERPGAAQEVQVVEPDAVEEAKAADHLFEDAPGDLRSVTAQFDVAQPLKGVADAHFADRGQVKVFDEDMPRLKSKPGSATGFAGGPPLVVSQLGAHHLRARLEEAPLQLGMTPSKRF